MYNFLVYVVFKSTVCLQRISEVHERRSGFVEVADGRVSRVHCVITCKEAGEKLRPQVEVRCKLFNDSSILQCA